MFAGDNPAVADTDIVISVDINLFVMTPEIIRPLISSPDMVAWIMDVGLPNNYTNKGNYWPKTFALGFMAMRAASWREITGYNGSIEGLVRHYREEGMALHRSNPEKDWYTDQLIITWALLSSKVCTVPARSKLWEMPGIQFDPALDDSKTCFHGIEAKSCNIRRSTIRQGCKWWHFFANQGFKSHLDVFYKSTNNTITLNQEIIGQ